MPADSASLVNRIAGGMPRDRALRAFVRACNQPGTLFITKSWIAPRLEKLHALLADPITGDQAAMLRDVAWERLPFEDAFEWLEEPALSWADYLLERRKKALAVVQERLREGYFPWPDVETARADAALQQSGADGHGVPAGGACPKCRGSLVWIFFRSPEWTWVQGCGRLGWLAVCDACRLQADFRRVFVN
jgi:hypothetical protein